MLHPLNDIEPIPCGLPKQKSEVRCQMSEIRVYGKISLKI